MAQLSILFLGKKNDRNTQQAIDFLSAQGCALESFTGTRHDQFPIIESDKQWDFVISYLSPWIVPAWLLAKAKKAAINFHPGPPEYPGIGCTNFAIYNEEKEFGVTCHHMAAKVDRGDIIAVARFPLATTDTVYSLTKRCYEHIAQLFESVFSAVIEGKDLPLSSEQWRRVPYTRKELDALCVVTVGMDASEIKRRIRATSYPGMPGAYVELGGERFCAEKSINCKE